MRLTEFSETFDLSASKIRRYALEFLGYDPDAGRQSGRARELDEKDAYRVFLGYHLVSELGFGVNEAKGILSDIDCWLKKRGLYPGEEAKCDPRIKRWTIKIERVRHGKNQGFSYSCEGLLSENTKIEEGELILTTKTVRDWAESRMTHLYNKTNPNKEVVYVAAYSPIILMISELFEFFKQKINIKEEKREKRGLMIPLQIVGNINKL